MTSKNTPPPPSLTITPSPSTLRLFTFYNLHYAYLILASTEVVKTRKKQRVRYRTIIIRKQTTSSSLDISESGWYDDYTVKGHLKELVAIYNGGRDITWGANVASWGRDVGGTREQGGGNGKNGERTRSKSSVAAADTTAQLPIAVGYGIVGLVRFLDCYYITIITKRLQVGSIGGCEVWTVRGTEAVQLRGTVKGEIKIRDGEGNKDTESSDGSGVTTGTGTGTEGKSIISQIWSKGKRTMGLGLTNREIEEMRYQGLWGFTDLGKGFYFSYSYDLTRNLQSNMISSSISPHPPPPIKTMYAWNYSHTRLLDQAAGNEGFHWVLPLVHGSYEQRKVEVGGKNVDLILLARRSRHFAGTRYLKRGVSDAGKTANDVEHEQIVVDDTGGGKTKGSGFVQVRGSIPTYWAQETSGMTPKPPILLNRVDPVYKATRMHFQDLMERYGGPIVVLDLVKQSEKREREVIVGNEYRHAIEYLNSLIDQTEHKIRYCALDYSHVSKHRSFNVSKALDEAATWAVNMTGFFVSDPKKRIEENGEVGEFRTNRKDGEDKKNTEGLSYHLGVPVATLEQRGVLRTNCIDCLDRTNVAQFSAGVCALGQQLLVMGVTGSAELEQGQAVVSVLMDMYSEIGDCLALQYGGSEAHKKVASGNNASVQGPSMGKHKEFLTSIRRYYSNTFTDRLKQDAMNLFLGNFVPKEGGTPLWEMENDYYLHNFHVQQGANERDIQFQQDLGVAVGKEEGEEEAKDTKDETGKKKSRSMISRGLRKVKKRTTGRSTSPKRKDRSKSPTQADAAPEIDLPESQGGSKMVSLIKARAAQRARVEKRCSVQKSLLSSWWKEALQSYLQSRMWMQLGSPTESILPTPFDRLYTPSKLTEFDEYFSHNWATPSRKTNFVVRNKSPMFGVPGAIASGISVIGSVGGTPGIRSSPSSDKGEEHESPNLSTYQIPPLPLSPPEPSFTTQVNPRRNSDPVQQPSSQIPPRPPYSNANSGSYHQQASASYNPNNAPINYYMRKIGTKAKNILTYPVTGKSSNSPARGGQNHISNILTNESSQSGDLQNGGWNYDFLGDPKTNEEDVKKYEEFVAYAGNPKLLAGSFNPVSFSEFTSSLAEITLNSDDVEGMRKLAISAHITNEIRSGPYEGLLQDSSAVGVATLVHSQLDVLGSAAERGDEEDGRKQMAENLQKNGIEATCMQDLIEQKWKELKDSREINREILEDRNLKSMRSELTTEEGLNLYCKYYDEDSIMGDKELQYMLGPSPDFPSPQGSASGGALVTVQAGSGRKGHVREGFEQINDDLFARRANKFMVFNGVGMREWTTKPVTKKSDDGKYVRRLFGENNNEGEEEGGKKETMGI